MQRVPPRLKGRPRRKSVRGCVARNILAEDNSRLVTWAVTRFFRRLDYTVANNYLRDDAHGDAWTGFLRACELWEPRRGALSAYAWYWMKQAMQVGLAAALNLIHVPVNRRPESRVPCSLKEDWQEQEAPANREEEMMVVICRSDALEALEKALNRIDKRQALAVRMRLKGDTWPAVAKALRITSPQAHVMEQEGRESLRKELEHIKELV